MNFILKYYPEARFGGFSDVDGTIRFYTRVNSLIDENDILLDVGCGRGEYQDDTCEFRKKLRILKGKCKKVIGIDVDTNAKTNPYIDEFFFIGDGDHWLAIEDHSIDIIICDYVLEHIKYPDKIFSEFKRVLKEGGILCARTPNLLSYFGIISNLIPDKLHATIVDGLQDQRKPEDVFPKFYNCNTTAKMRKLMRSFDFDGVAYCDESEPAYFSFSGLVFRIVKVIHEITPRFLRTQLYLFATKKSASISPSDRNLTGL